MPPSDSEAAAGVVPVSLRRSNELAAESRERFQVLALTILSDAVILAFAFGVVTVTRYHTLIYLDNLWLLHRDQFLVSTGYLAAIAIAGGYSPSRILDRFDAVYFPALAVGVAGIAFLALWSLVPDGWFALSRRELFIGTFAGVALLAVWRFYLGGLASNFASLRRAFVVLGPEGEAKRICEEILKAGGAQCEAAFAALEELEQEVEEDRTRAELLYRNRDAIIALTHPNRHELIRTLEFCEQHCARTFIYPSLHDTLFFPHSKVLAVGGVPLIEVSSRRLFTPYLIMKRLIDIGAAGFGLLLAAPIGAATALAIVATSPGPVFYTQERVGLGGRRFKLYKFRSMVANAEANTGPVWAASNDSRVTPVGRFIRKHRIDEIPQLMNVLKGDMSLIGPRPERPHFHEEFCKNWPLFERRLAVRPGVTSLSHVLGSYESDPVDRLRYDLIYINNLSFIMDVRILAATVRVVLGAKGAQ
ncbi:MAG: sugar transferase [Candidatus Hydrogenedentes bacterium]|nr:sugar transferase [Candidatus Hydrogenedentota bacterium]